MAKPAFYSTPMSLSDIVFEMQFALPAGKGWAFISENWRKDRYETELKGCTTVNAALRRLAPIAKRYEDALKEKL